MTYDEAPNFVKQTIKTTISKEKGDSDNPDDRGGKTRDGITQKTASAYGIDDVFKATDEEIRNIYLNEYYLKPHFDLVAQQSLLVTKELFDTGVNLGYHKPCIWFQQLLNILNKKQKYYNDIAVDGIIGKNTMKAYEKLVEIRGSYQTEKVFFNVLNSLQCGHYFNLALDHESQETFIWGWITQRCDYVVDK